MLFAPNPTLCALLAQATEEIRVRLIAASPPERHAEIRQVLESLQKTFPDYAWIGLANPDGTVYAATQGLPTSKLRDFTRRT